MYVQIFDLILGCSPGVSCDCRPPVSAPEQCIPGQGRCKVQTLHGLLTHAVYSTGATQLAPWQYTTDHTQSGSLKYLQVITLQVVPSGLPLVWWVARGLTFGMDLFTLAGAGIGVPIGWTVD